MYYLLQQKSSLYVVENFYRLTVLNIRFYLTIIALGLKNHFLLQNVPTNFDLLQT